MENEERKLTIADYEEVFADHCRLVRELDVLLNGAAGAAKQASLCDIVAQFKAESVSRHDLEAVAREQVDAVMDAAQGPHTGNYQTDAEAWPHCGLDSDQFHTVLLGVLREHFPATPAPTVGAQTDWVSVEERLPETNDEYLVYWSYKDNSGNAAIGVQLFKDGEFMFDGEPDNSVTHWKPLPAPPTPAAQPKEEK